MALRRLLCLLALSLIASASHAETTSPTCRSGAGHFARVDLFMGVSRRAGARAAWQQFLARVVTPRFPDGLTVLEASGQWRGRHGLDHEASRILVILYKRDDASDRKIEAISAAYKASFKQRSVLRVDTDVCASF